MDGLCGASCHHRRFIFIQTPIVGLVTEDVFHHGQLISRPARRCTASLKLIVHVNVSRATDAGAVWQDGQELMFPVLPWIASKTLTRELGKSPMVVRDCAEAAQTDNLAEVKLFVASLLVEQPQLSPNTHLGLRHLAVPSLQNAPLMGAQSVLDRYANKSSNHRT